MSLPTESRKAVPMRLLENRCDRGLTVYHDSTHKDLDNLIRSLSRKHAKRFCLDYRDHGPDLVQTGWLGALRASDRYQDRGLKFTTYAYYFISGDIRRACVRLATDRHLNVSMDTAYNSPDFFTEDEHTTNGATTPLLHHQRQGEQDPTFDMLIHELLATNDGLELLAAELGYRDQTKTGAKIRAQQLDALRQRYEHLQAAA
jgi:DNA-directed RNA polymerase specialized sigma24 family protein